MSGSTSTPVVNDTTPGATSTTLAPAAYYIVVNGAQGGPGVAGEFAGGAGAEVAGELVFTSSTTLTIDVGGAGGYGTMGGGGGGGSFVVLSGTPLAVAGGGGGGSGLATGGAGQSGTSGGAAVGGGGTAGSGGNGGTGGFGGAASVPNGGVIGGGGGGGGGFKSAGTAGRAMNGGGGGQSFAGGLGGGALGAPGTDPGGLPGRLPPGAGGAGGFGGGGGGGGSGFGFAFGGGGGGGGYSGGAGGSYGAQGEYTGGGGGGGGSFLASGVTNAARVTGGAGSGSATKPQNGSVIIYRLVGSTIDVSGTGQTTTIGANPVKPFAGVTITDANPTNLANPSGPTETVTINLNNAGNGTLSDPNASTDGSSFNSATGVYKVSGTAAQVTADLAALVFTAGKTGNTTFNIADTNWTGLQSTVNKVTVSATFQASSITGAVANQTTTDAKPIAPFAGVTITDPNGPSATETVVVSVGNSVNGTLSDPNAATDHSITSGASITLTGSAAAVTAAIDALIFTPTANQVPPGQHVTTGFTIRDTNSGGRASPANNTTSVVASSVNDPPAISGTKAGQTTTGTALVSPFAGVSVTDPDKGASDSLIIKLTGAGGAATDANGVLSGSGLTRTGTGTYALAATTPTALSRALDALVFTPSAGAPNTAVTTTFALAASDGSATTTDSITTVIDTTAICYLRGTRILTPTGAVPIEELAIGDRVVTRFSGTQSIKWIGRQSYDPRFVRAGNIPVRIRAGALGDGMPARDLFVSPGHSMLVDGQLVLARCLVNGITVTRATGPAAIDYYQIELAQHDCLIAEGVWSETFADGPGLRGQFHNAAAFAALYPNHPPAADLSLCAPRPECGPRLEAALRPIVARATARVTAGPLRGFIDRTAAPWRVEGWAQDIHHPDLPVLLEVLVGETVIATTLACEDRQDLRDAGLGGGRNGFSVMSPARLDPAMLAALRVRRVGDRARVPMTPECRAGVKAGRLLRVA